MPADHISETRAHFNVTGQSVQTSFDQIHMEYKNLQEIKFQGRPHGTLIISINAIYLHIILTSTLRWDYESNFQSTLVCSKVLAP